MVKKSLSSTKGLRFGVVLLMVLKVVVEFEGLVGVVLEMVVVLGVVVVEGFVILIVVVVVVLEDDNELDDDRLDLSGIASSANTKTSPKAKIIKKIFIFSY